MGRAEIYRARAELELSILGPCLVESSNKAFEPKGTFTHPVYACDYRTALRFFITYLGLLISMEK